MVTKPYFEKEGATIYHGDCLEVMRALPSSSIDLIITSPPYNCRKQYGTNEDQIAWADYYAWIGQVLDECYRLLVLGGTLAINVPMVIRWQAEHRYAHTWCDFDASYQTHRDGKRVVGKGRIEPIGFRLYEMMRLRDCHLREPIVWIKGAMGSAISTGYQMGCDSDPYMRPAHDMIWLGSKGRWFHRGGTGRRGALAVPFLDETKDVWFVSPTSHKSHPAPFPLEIPERLIRLFTHAVDAVVLDPFAGTGTTGVAALNTGRRATLIEKEEKYCEIAAKRLEQVSPLSFPLPSLSSEYEVM